MDSQGTLPHLIFFFLIFYVIFLLHVNSYWKSFLYGVYPYILFAPPPSFLQTRCVCVCFRGGGCILRGMHCAIYCLFMPMCISKEIISIHCIFNLYLLTLTVHYNLRMTCVVLFILTKTPPRASQSTIKRGSRGGGV